MYHAFQHTIETFPHISVKCSLQNAPYFSFSPFQHWQVDNGNVLDSQSAAGDDIWEGEWASLLLHDRSPLQDQEADLNSLLKGPGQESYLRLATAQYSAHQQNPDFSVHSGRGRMAAPHCPACRFVSVQGQSDVSTNSVRFMSYLSTGSSLVKQLLFSYLSEVSLSKCTCFSRKSLLECIWGGSSFSLSV